MVGKAFPCCHKSWLFFCKFFYKRDLQRLVIYSFIYEEMQSEKKILCRVIGGLVLMVMYIHSSWLFSLLLLAQGKMLIILLEDNFPGPFPIGQVIFKSYLPRKKIY